MWLSKVGIAGPRVFRGEVGSSATAGAQALKASSLGKPEVRCEEMEAESRELFRCRA